MVDVFGGSGLLSHHAKALCPKARVIYNDFDGYSKRLAQIPQSNEMPAKLRPMLDGVKRMARLTDAQKADILAYLSGVKEADWRTISVAFLFSGNFATSLEALAKAR